ncbi:MAG TPA: DUF1080 domain-containing protein [Pirellulales bacterium]|nr:DUF1080 domain-containing protein [Pirellulales bacterium]
MTRFFHMTAVAATLLAGQIGCAAEANTLSDDEKTQGFELLFNGKDLKDWQQSGNWVVDDGAITRSGKGGSLTYKPKEVPDDFELRFDWKVAEGSNSGVYYRPTQYEYQILDNAHHHDGEDPRTSAASLYFCMAPSHDATKPVGQWNEGRVICQRSVIQHWLNGEKVIDFDYMDKKWEPNVELWMARGGDPAARGANLNLQDHGDPVWYRNVKMRALKPDETLDRTPVTPAAIPQAMLDREQEIIKRIEARQKK